MLSLFLCWWWFFGSCFSVHYAFMADCMSNLIVFSLIRWPQWKGALKYPPSWTLRWSMSKMLWSWSTITMSPVRLLNNSSRFSNRMHSYVAVCVSSSLFHSLVFCRTEDSAVLHIWDKTGHVCVFTVWAGLLPVWGSRHLATDGTPSINQHPLLALSLTTALVILLTICN